MTRRDWPEPVQRYRRTGGIEQAVYEWAPASEPPRETVVLLHGWMDAGRSFAPLVAGLAGDRRYLALDWRGFGASQSAPDGRYMIPDYLADLDEVLNAELAAGESVTLLGHSLGGNIAGVYAGIRPHRVRGLISLEGFGLPESAPKQAPHQYRAWLDSTGIDRQRHFPSRLALARHIRRLNPQVAASMVAHLTDCWGEPDGEGGMRLRADPAHRRPNPALYRLRETLACWECIRCPVLWVEGEVSSYTQRLRTQADWSKRLAAIDRLSLATVPGVGHGLIHEAPDGVAAVLEANWPVASS